MCGIFGVITKESSDVSKELLLRTVNSLFRLSESRGKEAAGIALRSENAIKVLKAPHCASQMIATQKYRDLFKGIQGKDGCAIIGHSRLVTSGSQVASDNNQPIIKGNLIGIHNGIITNADMLWKEVAGVEKEFDVDTEAIWGMLISLLSQGDPLTKALRRTYEQIEGSASIAILFRDMDQIALATNNGSIYFSVNEKKDAIIFASENYILKVLSEKKYFIKAFGKCPISQLKARKACLLDLRRFELREFSLSGEAQYSCPQRESLLKVIEVKSEHKKEDYFDYKIDKDVFVPDEIQDAYERWTQRIRSLKYCAKCILPETFPFIKFDQASVCNYCHGHRKLGLKGEDALEKELSQYRSDSGDPDCIVAFSGGRDSSYGLHYLKTVLKMNPIAYTYDWGMLTDLARNNQARICGKLGIEHVLVSADITKKRKNIQKNVSAWLKQPDLGMIPLFMAGDKQYFYYANQLSRQTGIKLIILCNNNLEESKFKAGFGGVYEGDEYWYDISWSRKLKLAAYYAKKFILNPAYLNSSLGDTLFGYISSYMIKHDYLSLYDYIPWDGKKIFSTLRRQYNWEFAGDTESTWRIGDGTAAFYNYIYYMMAGFTENDTFRSNQIREGLITRGEAVKTVRFENQPRYDSIKWYCDVIRIDYLDALRVINSAPKFLKH